MHLEQTAALAGGTIGAFLIVAVVVLAVMIAFFAVRWRQHRHEETARQFTAAGRPNPHHERRR